MGKVTKLNHSNLVAIGIVTSIFFICGGCAFLVVKWFFTYEAESGQMSLLQMMLKELPFDPVVNRSIFATVIGMSTILVVGYILSFCARKAGLLEERSPRVPGGN